MIINTSVLSCILILTIRHNNSEWVLQDSCCQLSTRSQEWKCKIWSETGEERAACDKYFNQNIFESSSQIQSNFLGAISDPLSDPFHPPLKLWSREILWVLLTWFIMCSEEIFYWQSAIIRLHWEHNHQMMIICTSMSWCFN